ncbi:FAD-dependent oxidoreductase [Maribacter sp. ANRC-HE7]|uniref:FAD-dependent oxidoreductase n=1 Tax=Maribacter aquimaris TaxID=2737171 RepID=A0ABR7UYD2_9FLAO|nr:NAD(P)/FAD-dependent oxidoreductase [Maribacter aquimaris]MBD0777615.1 FAD-dependent oxidoreductase [Maribacter aquimaris]
MEKKDHNIHIIGAGVSGLIAAKVLEDQGFYPKILEASDTAGGRVKSETVAGYTLDHGFQVLLTAYPAVQKYLDLKALDLQQFIPGAAIFNNGKQNIIGDPLRNIRFLFPTVFSGIGNFSDKLKVLQLNRILKQKSVLEIFEEQEETTLSYLTGFGFSPQMIEQFFRPFFSGIFLEPDLRTSSRMFQFVYKMFGEGHATLPKSGIAAIPQQLVQQLEHTTIRYNCPVASVKNKEIVLDNGEVLQTDYTIVATEASALIPNLKNQTTAWHSCETLYFETETKVISYPLIGLIADKSALINNLFYPTSLHTSGNTENELLSVTVVKDHHLSAEALIAQVQEELKRYCNIDTLKFLKKFTIPKALPDLIGLTYGLSPSETQLTSEIFLAGDTLLNGSLNAAMISGESAAKGLMDVINGVTYY